MKRIIEITVSPTGESIVQTQGFAGTSCREASRFVEQALGEIQSDTPTAEMYRTVTTPQPIEQRQ
jgi:hypothetical protein